ncbi:MAG: hypothetical protein WCT23_09935 [Candidatus Neomarinimicrobiota bacterium]
MSEILDTLMLSLSAERDAAGLIRLDPAIITDATARMDELTEQARLGNHLVMDELDALTDMFGTLANFRRQKIASSIGRGRPPNMLPAEAAYLDGLATLTATLEDAWGLRA